MTDNQWVNQGDLIAELDPRDYEARLAAAEAALSAARAGQKSRAFGGDVIEITSTAGVDEASAAVEGAKAAVETARAAVATAKSQQAQAQAQLAAVQAGLKQAQADLLAAEARQQRAGTFLKRIEALVPDHAASQDSLDEAVAAEGVANADVSAVRQRITAQEAAVSKRRGGRGGSGERCSPGRVRRRRAIGRPGTGRGPTRGHKLRPETGGAEPIANRCGRGRRSPAPRPK